MNNTVVLLFDEDKDFIKEIIGRLAGSNFVVYWACSLDEAMEYYEENIIDPDLLVVGNIADIEKTKEFIKNFYEKYPKIKVLVSNSEVEASNKLLSGITAKFTLHDPQLIIFTLKAAI